MCENADVWKEGVDCGCGIVGGHVGGSYSARVCVWRLFMYAALLSVFFWHFGRANRNGMIE